MKKTTFDILMEAIKMVEPKDLRGVILNALEAYLEELKELSSQALEALK